MTRSTRRDFLKTTVAAGMLTGVAGISAASPTKKTATDLVTLGDSGVKVTRLAFGTGTFSGRVQRDLGQADFTALVRHAYDRGVRFFETADSYHGMPQMLAAALKGVPRDSYRLMTKYNTAEMENPQATIRRLCSDLGTDHVDIMLLHCVRSPHWPEELKPLEDAFSEAKEKKIILAHGASVHGLQPLRRFPGDKWLDVAMIRMNNKGVKMDSMDTHDSDRLGDVEEVVEHVKQVHGQGIRVISMKLVGEGRFTQREERQAALKFAMNVAGVDAVTIGYKNTGEIDEAIENMNLAFS